MRFKVRWKYTSSLGGPFLKDDVVELDEAKAEAINRDSPGVLVAVQAKKAGQPVDEKTIMDRAVRQAETRGRAQGEVMTSDNFAAVKPKEE
jgi:hypothetical protein